MNEKPEKAVPLRDRRKLLRQVRDVYGITLVELGKAADLSNPMLSQFETGARDLSTEAWARVLLAMRKLIPEAKAKRTAAEVGAQRTAERLGLRVEDVKESTGYGKVLEETVWHGVEQLVRQEVRDLRIEQIQDAFNSLEQMEPGEQLRSLKSFVNAFICKYKEILELVESGSPLPPSNQVLFDILHDPVLGNDRTED